MQPNKANPAKAADLKRRFDSASRSTHVAGENIRDLAAQLEAELALIRLFAEARQWRLRVPTP
jgi:hypothetical protein